MRVPVRTIFWVRSSRSALATASRVAPTVAASSSWARWTTAPVDPVPAPEVGADGAYGPVGAVRESSVSRLRQALEDGQGGEGGALLVGAAQPEGQLPDHQSADPGMRGEEPAERVAADDGRLDGAEGPYGGAARVVVQRGHFSKEFAGPP